MTGETSTPGFTRSLTGTLLAGRYRLERKLGSGGMSTVYLALDETLERMVAVKLLHAEISDEADQIERFRREARAVAQLSHPNVVSVIDAGEAGGRPFIVFEYVEGETLKQRIDRLGRLPLDEATAYAIEIGRGLAAANARMLVHRDVKPQNVLIDPEGRAKVTDFGIALSLESDGLTKTGRVLGTTDYVSPEQAMGRQIDARSDIYSLGVLLYEMLTGDVPFKAETQVGVAMKHVNDPLPNVQRERPEASAALAAVIDRATAKEPKQRYEDMTAMLADLEEALDVEIGRAGGSQGEATNVIESVPEPRRRITGRRISVAGILLVLAATGVAIAIAGLFGDKEPSVRGGGGEPVVSGAPIEIVSADDFDPEGTPTPSEHPEEVGGAIDGNPTTGWSTETYEAGANLQSASGKAGVGLILDTGEPAEARTMTVQSADPGWDFDVFAANEGPPDSLDGWGEPVGGASNADAEQTVPLELPSPSRYYLLWITELANGPEGFSVDIQDVELTS